MIPASDKQVAFIDRLKAQKIVPAELLVEFPNLSKLDASKLIDLLMALPNKAVVKPAGVIEAQGGEYHVVDGVVYRTQESKAGKVYALRLDVPEAAHGRATWVYEAGAIRKIDSRTRITVEQAGAFGHLHGFCFRCGRRLDDPISVERGFGPVCAKKMGWDRELVSVGTPDSGLDEMRCGL